MSAERELVPRPADVRAPADVPPPGPTHHAGIATPAEIGLRPTTPTPDADVGEIVRAALTASTIRLIEHDPGARVGEDLEDVHQARVATRRLRSDLRTFRRFLDDAWVADLRAELAWLGGALGAVRDADVLLARLRGRGAELGRGDEAAARRLLERLATERDEARDRLIAAIEGARYRALVDRLAAASRDPAVIPDGTAPAGEAMPPLLRQRWRRLEATVDRLETDPDDEALHAIRIRTKRIRYAAEALAPVFGPRARGFARAAATLQDVLGEHQDSVVARAWLRAATNRGGARASFVAGRLTELERRRAEAVRAAWPEAWRELRRKRHRFWTSRDRRR